MSARQRKLIKRTQAEANAISEKGRTKILGINPPVEDFRCQGGMIFPFGLLIILEIVIHVQLLITKNQILYVNIILIRITFIVMIVINHMISLNMQEIHKDQIGSLIYRN